jgi:hypothetical protein
MRKSLKIFLTLNDIQQNQSAFVSFVIYFYLYGNSKRTNKKSG